MSLTSIRVSLSLFFGLLAVLAFYVIAPPANYPISGIFLPTHPATVSVSPGQVKLFTSNQVPKSLYQSRGRLNVVWHSIKESEKKEHLLLGRATAMAAKGGANAIVVSVLGHTAPGIQSRWASYRFEGEAVYMPQLESLEAKENS